MMLTPLLLGLLAACAPLRPARTDGPPALSAPPAFPRYADDELAAVRAADDARWAQQDDELARAAALVIHVHGLTAHDGARLPEDRRPAALLAAAEAGATFRCVEFSVALAALWQAQGGDARVVGLKRRDVERARVGAGHVVAELWLPEKRRWVMVDGQWGVLPTRDGQPLSAWELREALVDRAPLQSAGVPTDMARYGRWIAPYLTFFDVAATLPAGPQRLMLVPEGLDPPTVFQRTSPLDASVTRSADEFYAAPNAPGAPDAPAPP